VSEFSHSLSDKKPYHQPPEAKKIFFNLTDDREVFGQSTQGGSPLVPGHLTPVSLSRQSRSFLAGDWDSHACSTIMCAGCHQQKIPWYGHCCLYECKQSKMEVTMNWEQVKGNWKQVKGKVKQQWGKLTDDELDEIEGKRDQLLGKIQKQYGISKEEAERQVNDWERQL
jgi:uncharacterized protein YjbJ (UPF0337 family)